MDRFKIIFSVFALAFYVSACSHTATKEDAQLRAPAVVTPVVEVEHTMMNVELAKADWPVDAYRVQVKDSTEPEKLVLYFGPPPSGEANYPDITALLKTAGFRGIFIFVTGDMEAQQVFSAPKSFDNFYQALNAQFQHVGWLDGKISGTVLVGFGSGAETINRIGMNPSTVLSTGILGLAFFDPQFTKDIPGVEKLVSVAPIGFKNYAVTTREPASLQVFDNISEAGESDRRASVEAVFETLPANSVKHEKLLETCLTSFLQHLSMDPFISYRCQNAH